MSNKPVNELNEQQGQVLDSSNRESMEYDVLIVGAGPAGLSAAIQIKQLAQKNNSDISVCVFEKASEIGAHILSGAVIETSALDKLLPNWKEMDSPIKTKVKKDKLSYLGKNWSINFPQFLLPPMMKNHGNYIVSLGNVCKWLSEVAENLGVEIYPGLVLLKFLLMIMVKFMVLLQVIWVFPEMVQPKTLGNQEWSFMQIILFFQRGLEDLFLNS